MRTAIQILDQTARQRFLTAILAGNTIKTAARLARVPHNFVLQLFQQIEQLTADVYYEDDMSEHELELIEFYKDVQMALANAESNLVTIVKVTANTDWRAAQFLLKAQNPEDWDPDTKRQLAAQPKQETNQLQQKPFDPSKLTVEELEQLEQLMLKASTNFDAKQLTDSNTNTKDK